MIYRTYACDDCDTVWEYHHDSGDEPAPDCPTCSKVLQWQPKSFAIGGSNEGKAVKMAQTIMEEDFGLTNFKDNNKEGDVGVVMPSYTTSENEQLQREVKQFVEQKAPEQVNAFWGSNAGQPTTLGSVTGQSLIQNAKVGPAAVDPMALLHKGVKSGALPTLNQMTKIVAKVPGAS
jgi:hypothetical protein